MAVQDIPAIVSRQRQYFETNATRPVDFRIAQLKALKKAMKEMEPELLAALAKDLGKSDFEGYTSEVGFTYEEINHTIDHVADWARPVRVATPLLHQPSSSRIHAQPKGVTLIIGPWNYPFQLLMSPLVGALGAGNTAVLKASEIAPATAAVIAKLVEKTFKPEYVAYVEGGIPETTELLKQRFDHIFFTGSIPVGKIVMRAAAENLTPVTLELGGKSPCFVDKKVDLKVAARRIVWGKFYNAGQTCVAPDYLLVDKAVKADLMTAMKAQIKEFFGEDPQKSPDYGRIVSDRHFDRLVGMVKAGKVAFGGESDKATRYLAPTVLDDATMADKAMEDEIFGPILPVLTVDDVSHALKLAKQRPNPLACYVFTNDSDTEDRIVEELPFGGGCINNALIHLANPNLPFGGVGESGMGAYHGKDSFDVFSHRKGLVKTSTLVDVKLKYPPYAGRLSLIKKFMR